MDPRHWLQFDAKNQEFFGIPKYGDAGQKEYILVAEDREGLSATDALVVVVSHPLHREYNTLFEMTLGMPYDEFNNSAVQRRFVERIAQIFGDSTTSNIQIRAIRKMHQSGKTLINYYNTTLHRPHHVCPTEHIEQLRKILVQPDGNIRHRIKDALGGEFDLNKVNLIPMGACLGRLRMHCTQRTFCMNISFYLFQRTTIPFTMHTSQSKQTTHNSPTSAMIIC